MEAERAVADSEAGGSAEEGSAEGDSAEANLAVVDCDTREQRIVRMV